MKIKKTPWFVIETSTMTDKNNGHVIQTRYYAREFDDEKTIVDYMESRLNVLKHKGYTIEFSDDGRVNCTNKTIGQTRVLSVRKQQFFMSKEEHAKRLMEYVLSESGMEEPTDSLNALMRKAFGESYNFT